jgi:hypothetical protein
MQVFFAHDSLLEAIMEVDAIKIVELELKYCERCGGLWLRPQGDKGVYCPPCVPKMAEFPPPRVCRPGWAVAGNLDAQEANLEQLLAICSEGGHA